MSDVTPLFSSTFLMLCWAQEYAAYCAAEGYGLTKEEILQVERG